AGPTRARATDPQRAHRAQTARQRGWKAYFSVENGIFGRKGGGLGFTRCNPPKEWPSFSSFTALVYDEGHHEQSAGSRAHGARAPPAGLGPGRGWFED